MRNTFSATAVEIDRMVEADVRSQGGELAPVAGDEQFLRRVYLDVIGRPPEPTEIARFLDDDDPQKRSRAIDELLDDPAYGRRWGRYWADVVTFRVRGEDDHLRVEVLVDWLADQLQQNVPWDQTAAAMITATGRSDRQGPANFILAHMGRAEDLAAETARVFMGIQLQCVQCHDAPGQRWKRAQFHELASFFARVGEMRVADGEAEGEQVAAVDGLSKPSPPFEVKVFRDQRYYMPDKDDSLALTAMNPRFLTGERAPPELADGPRRAMLAGLVAGRGQWFARAFVNRTWAELVGRGFVEPVDDMDSERPSVACPLVLNRLASAWRGADYDVKLLMRTILNTATYQREIRDVENPRREVRFAAATPVPLRYDQLAASLAGALGTGVPEFSPRFRHQLEREFGNDPSLPFTEWLPTLSQALLMMNHPEIQSRISRRSASVTGPASEASPGQVVEGLYRQVLARSPSAVEREECQRYLTEVKDRREAVEDIHWALVNSAEFQSRR